MSQQAFFATDDAETTQTSGKVEVIEPAYSVQVNISGTTYNVDVKLQASIDETNWVDISGAESLAISADTSVLFDVSVGMHKFIRAVVTRNSGTFSVAAYISNGKW